MNRSRGVVHAASAKVSGRDTVSAWLVHAITVSGLVAGLLALVAVVEGRASAAIDWLLVATVIDTVDGPLARSWGVAEALPHIDGHVLDTVVDFVGCVVVPLAFLWRFELLPYGLALPVVSVAFVTSALWFARTDMMTDDNWFNGFPTGWNLVVPTLYLMGGAPIVNGLIVMVLALLQLTTVKFVHPGRVVELRPLTLAVTATWVLAIAVLSELHELPWWGPAALLVGPMYQAALSVRRTLADDPPRAR
jgi:phosphatidylcholine synthase